MASPLTAIKAAKASYPAGRKGPFLLPDGKGLNLQIMPSGTKSWILRFMMSGRPRTMGLGSYGDGPDGVSLAKARELAAEARALAKRGEDPIEARKKASKSAQNQHEAFGGPLKTFQQVALEYIEAHRVSWKNAKHKAQWTSTLRTYVFPVIGGIHVKDVHAEEVEQVLKPIWLSKNETASRTRGRIEIILDFAKAKGWRTGDNPARWKESLKYRLPNLSRVRRTSHHPALPWKRIPAFVATLLAKEGVAAKALLFCILTATRSGETRGARWSELDFENRIWTIPATRMKGGQEHRVPLTEAALNVLEQVKSLASNKSDLVFPSVKNGKPLSDMALSMLVRGMNKTDDWSDPPWKANDGRPIVVHGFRSTFRDWCEEETSTPHAVSEAALAHRIRNEAEAAYHRTDHLEKRRILMTQWGEWCISLPS
jgi:integrase